MDITYFRKAAFVSLTTMFLILMLLTATLPSATAYVPGAVMYAPPLTVPPTIDGIWSAGEWADAPQYTMTGPAGETSYIRAKFNSTHLLVIIDSPWDTTVSTIYYHENVWLAFDTLNDGGANPQWDDYLVHATTSWTQMGWMGTGNNWTQTWLGPGFATVQAGENFGWGVPLGTSPNSGTPHRISEMAVPLTYVGFAGSTVGFYAQVDDDSTDPDGAGWLPATAYAEWPPGAGGSPGWPAGWWGSAPCPAPSAWGNLKLASVMYAPPLTVPPTIDGIWSAGEWADAPQYTMTGNQTSYIRAKFNSTHLLVIIDSPWDTTTSTIYYHENVWLAFDTLNDGGANPQWDDYLVHATTSWTQMGWMGTGNNWTQTWLGPGFATVQAGENFGWGVPLGTSPNSGTPHRISEMAVPLTYVGSAGSTVGFYAQVDDDSTDPDGAGWLPATAYAEWPLGAGGSPGWPAGWWGSAPCPAPSAWGNLKLYAPVGILGDVNHDGIVDIVDLTIVALALWSEPGDPKWNPDADLNGDGLIDIVDLVIAGVNFGKTS